MVIGGGLAQRRLGRSGLQVSEFGLGGFQFTGEFGVPRSEPRAIIEAALKAGVTFFDTAPMYGFGESEEFLGRYLPPAGTFAGVISNKVGWLDRTVARQSGDDAYRSSSDLMRVVEHSLWLLRRDRIDVMMIHEPEWAQWGMDPASGNSVVLETLEGLKQQGVVGAIGIAGRDIEFNSAMIETGRVDVVLTFMHYDLATQDARDRLIPLARKHDVGVILGGPFRQGALASPQRDRVQKMKDTGVFDWGFDASLIENILRIYDLSDQWGMSLPEMGIRFLLSDPDVSSVIPGARSIGEFRQNLSYASKGPLPAELMDSIVSIPPVP
jgi:aryl-alcohol dehydrogenase-like predicted oxidoreductase